LPALPDPNPNADALSPELPNRPQFATTHWSLVLRASQRETAGSAAALEKLCRAYWFPLYAFARRDGSSSEDAQDLTQEFFSRLLAREYLRMADPSRGRFRSFLLSSFKHMMANERRAASRQKRGGGVRVFSLDEKEPEERYLLEPADHRSPDNLFERRWAETMLARVLDRLRAEYTGHAMRFDDLKTFLVESRGTVAFGEVAARLGVTEAAVKSVVHRMRRRYAELFRDEVAQTVADPAEAQDEMRHLISVLGE
jgi:RNA polymerase sigma-70 factor (ECF subfamily)